MQRPILATQSDYGTADGRAAALSGNILKIAPEADIYSVLDLYPEGDALNAGGIGETRIKFGDNVNGNEPDAVGYQLTPEELFRDPAPLDVNGTKNMNRFNIDGFYYNNTDRVRNHPIYTKQIGDPRWRTGAAWH